MKNIVIIPAAPLDSYEYKKFGIEKLRLPICAKNKDNNVIDISKIKKTGWRNKIDILKGLRLMLEKKIY